MGDGVNRVLLTVSPGLPVICQRAIKRAAIWAGFAEVRVLDTPLAITALHDINEFSFIRQNWLIADFGYQGLRVIIVEQYQNARRILLSKESQEWSIPYLSEKFQVYLISDLTEQFPMQRGFQDFDSSYLLSQLLQAYTNYTNTLELLPKTYLRLVD
jgi:hypothetical protein